MEIIHAARGDNQENSATPLSAFSCLPERVTHDRFCSDSGSPENGQATVGAAYVAWLRFLCLDQAAGAQPFQGPLVVSLYRRPGDLRHLRAHARALAPGSDPRQAYS